MRVQEFLDEFGIYSDPNGKNMGVGWIAVDCPFCGDTGQHGGFNLHSGGWNCWKCATKHKTRAAIKELTGVSWKQTSNIMDDYFEGFGVHSGIAQEIKKVPFKYPGGNLLPDRAKAYLRGRGFDPEYLITKYNVGWGGLSGDYNLRIIIPVYLNKRLLSYQGRDMTGCEGVIRYKDCSKAEAIIYHKNFLYNLDNCPEDWCIVVEGVTDVWALGDNVCATFGTGFTNQQIVMLADFFDRVIIWFDPGVNSQIAAKELAMRLSMLGVRAIVFVHVGENDVAELPEESRMELKEVCIKKMREVS